MNQWLDNYQHNIPTRTLTINTKVKWDINGKKGDNPKPEDKDSNMVGTAGAHVGYTTPHKESITSSGGASIDTHVLEAIEQLSRPTHFIEKDFRSTANG